jgi:serine/threonine-protein kinase
VDSSSSEGSSKIEISDDDVLSAGTTIAHYVVRRLHATAGYSRVYQAVDTVTGQDVAIKLLHERLSQSARHTERFRREYDALHSIRHPNVVETLDYGFLEDNRPYLVMEWCAGMNLETMLYHGGFTLEEAMPILRQVCFAVQAAHDMDVLHRDIKPANVILTPREGEAALVKLIDFGIATSADKTEAQRTSLTSTGACIGTPYAMAPEQIYGYGLGPTTDVYAIGILAFQLLTGNKPFTGATVAEVVDNLLNVIPPMVSDVAAVPAAFDHAVQRCLAKNTADRYQSVSAVLVAFEAAANATPPPPPDDNDAANAIGVHIELDFRCPEDEVEEEDFDRVDEMLEFAHQACTAAGLRVAIEAGSGFLAVGIMPDSVSRQIEMRNAALEFARTVAKKFDDEPSEAVSLSVVMHTGSVQAEFSDGATNFVGGDLLSIGEWSNVDDEATLIATTRALRKLSVAVEQVPDRPGYVRII